MSSVNKLNVSDLVYKSAVCFTRAVKSAFERGTSKEFHTTQLFVFVSQGIRAITKPLAAIQRTKIPMHCEVWVNAWLKLHGNQGTRALK